MTKSPEGRDGLGDLYLAQGVATKTEMTLRAARIRVARHIKPLLGSKKIADVMGGDIQRLMIEVSVLPASADEVRCSVSGT
ncbi:MULTISPECIES: hypothetical protein [unclassified Brevundimonas]|uniref:hypothetical protein n=1 Tax=unclassified Brevundimonas TaxID=2622653 RepID=UPI003F90C492